MKIEDVSQGLIDALTDLGDTYGPRGVAEAAAMLTQHQPRGVWWRLSGSTVYLDFAPKDRPPLGFGDWQWADETMATSIPEHLQLVPSDREPEPVEADAVLVREAVYDETTGTWTTDPTLPEFTDSEINAEASPSGDPPDTTDSAKGQVDP